MDREWATTTAAATTATTSTIIRRSRRSSRVEEDLVELGAGGKGAERERIGVEDRDCDVEEESRDAKEP